LFGNSLLFGGNAPVCRGVVRKLSRQSRFRSRQWRDYFDKLAQLPGYVARDVPHLPVINAFAEQARKAATAPRQSRP
jgi:2-oxoglutarate dehydrogenase E1 component